MPGLLWTPDRKIVKPPIRRHARLRASQLPRTLREYATRLPREPWLRNDRRIGDRLGSLQTFQETIVAMPIAGTNFATYTAAKTVIPAICLFPFPANYWQGNGKTMRIRAVAALNTLVTTPGTVVFQVMLGTLVPFTTGNIQLNATAHALRPCTLDVLMTNRTAGDGTAATFMGVGVLTGVMFTKVIAATDLWGRIAAADNAVGEVVINAPITTPANGAGFDSTLATTLDFFVGFSVSSGSNSITMSLYVVEILN